ncbi:ring zinc finger domain superfamily protein [Plasmopara halstedii]|uniref:RING-type E3 ubiquitin transferase n=1 Tax=Plasmopara halstedii TaxID=4781 RepID=A0A0N7L8M5_PLAHL|nr:ring zinc finger domain superfamily protein [Plasmopara halstedii]CEG50291.1 ring zinc finger domain superfamily protein [Plasmopara halstedii]|eukprot:XP_024586660.1 ring zinc finger domain superfamily protein [Plasmopara halstedii]
MGLRCSCLDHPHKYQRRQSDDLDMERSNDDSDEELSVLVEEQEGHELLHVGSRLSLNVWNSSRARSKRCGSIAGTENVAELDTSDDVDEEKHVPRSLISRLIGRGINDLITPLSPSSEELSRLLRSYQEITGVVDEGQLDLECIMCLDTFSENNPKVRTLCNCGINRTNFHMSCLLEWINRDANCPVCREYLYFEDL